MGLMESIGLPRSALRSRTKRSNGTANGMPDRTERRTWNGKYSRGNAKRCATLVMDMKEPLSSTLGFSK